MAGISVWTMCKSKRVKTYTGATEVTEPGSTGRVGKGFVAHACSMSALLRPAGMCGMVSRG